MSWVEFELMLSSETKATACVRSCFYTKRELQRSMTGLAGNWLHVTGCSRLKSDTCFDVRWCLCRWLIVWWWDEGVGEYGVRQSIGCFVLDYRLGSWFMWGLIVARNDTILFRDNLSRYALIYWIQVH